MLFIQIRGVLFHLKAIWLCLMTWHQTCMETGLPSLLITWQLEESTHRHTFPSVRWRAGHMQRMFQWTRHRIMCNPSMMPEKVVVWHLSRPFPQLSALNKPNWEAYQQNMGFNWLSTVAEAWKRRTAHYCRGLPRKEGQRREEGS